MFVARACKRETLTRLTVPCICRGVRSSICGSAIHCSSISPDARPATNDWVFRTPGGKSGSRGDADGVEIKSAEMEVDGVAESLAVAEPAR